MQKGLILGKFMPVHYGHLELIKFASKKCKKVILLLCSTCNETINGTVRYNWLRDLFYNKERIDVIHFYYRKEDLPYSFHSSKKDAYLWAQILKVQFPDVDCFISSKPDGADLANFMGIKSLIFTVDPEFVSVSGSNIRNNPYKFWSFIPEIVKKYYYRKVCLVGAASASKSSLTVKLAQHYNSTYITYNLAESAEIINDCSIEKLGKIAEEIAKNIIEKNKEFCKILFVDTDVIMTKSYANYLFNKDISFPEWIMAANRFDLYLFIENQDLEIKEENLLSPENTIKLEESIRQEFDFQQVFYYSIKGSPDYLFYRAIEIIDREFTFS